MSAARGRLAARPPAGALAWVGDLAGFAADTMREVTRLQGLGGEVLRQAAIISTGSTFVIVSIAFLAGGSCGLESTSLARSFGFDPIAGGFSSWCSLREVVPFVFGYIVAAKIGCGMVAELGAMRVHEEIDAIESMGIRSLAYLATTRFLACAIVLPVAYLLSVGAAYAASYLMSVERFGDVSPGTWKLFFFAFQDGWDLAYSMAKGLTIAAFVIMTSLYFGYGVRGGPVDVGTATARSMGVNIIGVTLISMLGTLIFWGANPRLPLG